MFLFIFLSGVEGVRAAEANRFNLPDKPTSPRFQVTDKKWPKKVGEADLCLWHDDKLAALSLGVDDNFPGEIDWWKEQAKLYDFKATWWIITGRIVKEGSSAGGLWSQFQELEKLGHAVESHTVTHLHVADAGWGTPAWEYGKSRAAKRAVVLEAVLEDGNVAPVVAGKSTAAEGDPAQAASAARPSAESVAAARAAAADQPASDLAKGVEWEYAQSIAQIERNIPGKKVSSLAYPGGKNTIYNDRNIAAKHFRVARGATGAPNMASLIDYMSTNAMSGWNFDAPHGGNPRNILDPQLYRGRYYRGWAILFAHGVGTDPKGLFAATFQFMKENREKLWIGLFTDVAKYGQERDTAKLKVESTAPDKITFLLTDEMDDSYFNFPLTVKVRIPDAWKEARASQAGKPVGARVIQHEGSAYALAEAVPDAGLVTLVEK